MRGKVQGAQKRSASSQSKPYYEKYLVSSSRSEGLPAFLAFLESLNSSDWFDLIDNLVEESSESWDVFIPQPGEDLVTYAASFINKVGATTRYLIRDAVGRHLSSLSKKLAEDASLKAKKVISLCRVLHDACDPAILVAVLENSEQDRQVRLWAAQTLANQPQSVPLNYWEKIDVLEMPELLPVVVSALAEYSPLTAIGALAKLRTKPKVTQNIEYPIRLALRQILRGEGGLENLEGVVRSLPVWARREVERVLAAPEFGGIRLADGSGPAVGPRRLLRLYLQGRIGLARLSQIENIELLLEETLSGWGALGLKKEEQFFRLLGLIRRFPSVALLRGCLVVLEASLRSSTASSGQSERRFELEKRVLGVLETSSVQLSMASGAVDLLEPLFRTLQLAFRVDELADSAFTQLVQQSRDHERVVVVTRAALRESYLSAEDCERILHEFYSEVVTSEILQAVMVESESPIDLDGEGLMKVGAKLYELNPVFVFNGRNNLSEEERLLIQDCVVPATFAELAYGLTQGVSV